MTFAWSQCGTNGVKTGGTYHFYTARLTVFLFKFRISTIEFDDGVDAETSLSLSLHLYLSSPPLHFILTLTFGQ